MEVEVEHKGGRPAGSLAQALRLRRVGIRRRGTRAPSAGGKVTAKGLEREERAGAPLRPGGASLTG